MSLRSLSQFLNCHPRLGSFHFCPRSSALQRAPGIVHNYSLEIRWERVLQLRLSTAVLLAVALIRISIPCLVNSGTLARLAGFAEEIWLLG